MNKPFFPQSKADIASKALGLMRDPLAGELIALEPRMVFDGAGLATMTEAVKQGTDGSKTGDSAQDSSQADKAADLAKALAAAAAPAAQTPPVEVVFIDSRVADIEAFKKTAGDNRVVVVVDAKEDGIKKITDTLSGLKNVSAVHIIGHGVEGSFELGKDWIGVEAVTAHDAEIETWKDSLATGADGLAPIYGPVMAPDDLLPPLRQDLRIMPAARLASGAPGWVIFDPIMHRYFQLGQGMVELLGDWSAGSVPKLLDRVRTRFGRDATPEEVLALRQFLAAHELLETPQSRALYEKWQARQHHWLKSLIHNYLFFRIPLVRPQAFLDRTKFVGEILFSKTSLICVALLGLIGMLLAARQWDAFVATGLGLLDWEGALILALCVPFVKTAHELGHAYMATRFGVRVPTIGLAFMVLAPFLYSDVTDAWRLSSRWQRLAIDCAGLLVELMIAALALFLWVFLPPGLTRSVVFALATTSLFLGLVLNLNPFMRFDGYHILADFLGIPNLQTRAMVIGRWDMREFLFGLGAPAPESMSRRRLQAMALYAYSIWIYRFFLFLGIAILVYHFAFKALGIILFLIEIIFFILLPIGQEVLRWWKGRDVVARTRRSAVTMSVLACAVLAFVLPLPSSLLLPAVATAKVDAAIFAGASGQIFSFSVREGQLVQQGDELMRLVSPDLEAQLRQAEWQMRARQVRLLRAAGNAVERGDLVVLENELVSAERKVAVLRQQMDDLILRAPQSGVVRDLDPMLQVGQWVSSKTLLLRVLAPAQIEIRGYAEEPDLRRIVLGAQGRFLPDDLTRQSFGVVLSGIGTAAVETLDLLSLASTFEGPVQVVQERADRPPKPLLSLYAVTLEPKAEVAVEQEVRGQVRLDGLSESMAARLARRVIGVLIRESGA